ncbi:MAG TPA: sigma-54 dependent transcriptional regulator [Methylomirabilota bacterium]|jgi:DNA-binding NtrC family response regulator|nr:sigma-54 dependent transcriptional regulator [Methylomirabilota bacterium]
MPTRVLIADNDLEMLKLLRQHLEAEGCQVVAAAGGAAAIAALGAEEYDIVLTDLVMDDIDGLAVLAEAQRRQPTARVILMTAFASLETAIAAMRHGADDYLSKPFKMAEVSVAVRRAVEDRRLRDENRRLRDEVGRRYASSTLLGESRAMQAVFEHIDAVAASEATILLIGESGTGKELVARAIHAGGARRDRPFVAVNCAAIPDALLESELFGHERGAFTGAERKRRGLFAEAHGGTMFLDEIADMSLALQAKLLRALQEKAVRSVGANEEVRLDVRVISATNRDLATLVRDGQFREDLYYRLAVIPVRLPALRERVEDIPLLARHFLDRAAATLGKRFDGFADDALTWLGTQRWPGNVRQLENVVERAATLARTGIITAADLSTDLAPVSGPGDTQLRPTLETLEREYIGRVLAETKGDKNAAARILGVSVRTLQRMFKPPHP